METLGLVILTIFLLGLAFLLPEEEKPQEENKEG